MNIKMHTLLILTVITTFFMVLPVDAGRKPPQTASAVSQLIADINNANSVGGHVTIHLAPGNLYNLKSANNTTDGGNGLPVIGGTKPVHLTIIGNGATIQRIAEIDRYYRVKNPFRLFDVGAGSSLTLGQVTLKGGCSSLGGAILNHGTLNVINGSTLSGNTGAIYNNGGIVTLSDSTLSGNNGGSGGGIHNVGGTVMVSNSTVSGNGVLYNGGGICNVGGMVTVSNGTLDGNSARFGGGIYNNGGTVTLNTGSTLSGNSAWHGDYPWSGGVGGGIYNASGSVTVNNSTLIGNTADIYFGLGDGIYNNEEVTVENSSSITGNGVDVHNARVLYLDNSSVIGVVAGNPAILFQ